MATSAPTPATARRGPPCEDLKTPGRLDSTAHRGRCSNLAPTAGGMTQIAPPSCHHFKSENNNNNLNNNFHKAVGMICICISTIYKKSFMCIISFDLNNPERGPESRYFCYSNVYSFICLTFTEFLLCANPSGYKGKEKKYKRRGLLPLKIQSTGQTSPSEQKENSRR